MYAEIHRSDDYIKMLSIFLYIFKTIFVFESKYLIKNLCYITIYILCKYIVVKNVAGSGRSSLINSRKYSVLSSRLGSFRSLNVGRFSIGGEKQETNEVEKPLNLLNQQTSTSLRQMNPFEEQQYYEWIRKKKRKGIRRRSNKRSIDQSSDLLPSSDLDTVIVVNADGTTTTTTKANQSTMNNNSKFC